MKGHYLYLVLYIATEYSALQNNETMKIPDVFLNYTILTEILKTSLLEETVSSMKTIDTKDFSMSSANLTNFLPGRSI